MKVLKNGLFICIHFQMVKDTLVKLVESCTRDKGVVIFQTIEAIHYYGERLKNME